MKTLLVYVVFVTILVVVVNYIVVDKHRKKDEFFKWGPDDEV